MSTLHRQNMYSNYKFAVSEWLGLMINSKSEPDQYWDEKGFGYLSSAQLELGRKLDLQAKLNLSWEGSEIFKLELVGVQLINKV